MFRWSDATGEHECPSFDRSAVAAAAGATSVEFSDKVTAVPNYLFSNFRHLEQVIGRSVTRIEYSAFYGCSALRKARAPSSAGGRG